MGNTRMFGNFTVCVSLDADNGMATIIFVLFFSALADVIIVFFLRQQNMEVTILTSLPWDTLPPETSHMAYMQLGSFIHYYAFEDDLKL